MLAFRTSQSIHSPKDWTSPELKEIDSLLRCPICYDFMHTAMILPDCSHTFCSFCIRHHLSHTNKCPVCNNSACENNLRNNRLVDDLIVEFKSVRSHLMEITQGLATERKGGSGRHVNKSISQEMTQNEVSLKKKTASKDDIIDLVSEDGDENGNTCVDTGSRENKENIGVVDQGLHTPRAKSGIQLSDVDKMGEFSSPRSQDSSFEGFLSPSQRKMVPCPVCGISLRQNAINEHLDICLGGEERKSALRKQMPKRKPIAKLVYNLMSEKDIKRKLKEVGLSTTGEKKALVRRHHDFVMLYNSECDSLKPRSVQDIVKEVEKTEAVRNRTRKDGNRLVIEKNGSPASIEKARKHYMKKHKSHFSCLIEETRKRMREQKENRKSLKERRQNGESQSETSVAVGCNTGTELTRRESDCETRRKAPGGCKRNKGAVTGGTHRDTGTSGKGEQNVVSSQSETESGGRSNRKKRKSQPDTAAEDTSDFEIVSLQSDSESESRHSEKRKGKPDVSVQLKTSGSSIQKGLINSDGNNEREGNLTTSDTFGGVGNVTSDKNDTSQVLAQTEVRADLRKKSRRNRSKGSNSKSQSKDNQSIQDTEESGQGRTRSRNKHTAGKADNSAFELTDVKKSDDNQADVGETDVQKRRRTRRVYDKPVSSSGSSRSKKTYRDAEIEDISSVCMKKAEIVPEGGWKGLNHDPSEGRFSIKPALLENEDNSPTFEVEKSNTSTVWNDEKRTTRKRNVKSASSSREKEMVDGEVNKPLPVVPDHGNKTDCFITTVPVDFSKVKWTEDEKDEQSRLQKQFLGSPLQIPEVNNTSSTAADGEVEIPPHSDTMEETGGGKGTQPLKTPSGKSEPLSSEGQCEQRREAETDYKDEDESAHVNETPVKDLDVANFSTMWPALSEEVDMSRARARHFSNMSTQSDKSSYSDLSAVISPVNNERGISIPGEKRSLRTSARRERVEDPKNRKRKRDCQSISRKRRRR